MEQLNDVKSNSASIDSTVCGYEAIKSWSNKQVDSQYIVFARVASQNEEFASSLARGQLFNSKIEFMVVKTSLFLSLFYDEDNM